MLVIGGRVSENYMYGIRAGRAAVSLGTAERQGDLFDDVVRFCDERLADDSLYGLLHRERDRLFPDEFFADVFSDRGRRSVPPSVVATVMVLQRFEGLSDRDAVERYSFDVRWRYAAGVGGYDSAAWATFAHTVLVDMRERLRRSERPDRVFEVGLAAAAAAGLIGRKRVLDSTPLYDAVATMDTITLIRSAIRGLLKVASKTLAAQLAMAMSSGDDYVSAAKPQIDWDDRCCREELIDTRAKDARAALAVLDGRRVKPEVRQAGVLLAQVVGQDLEEGDDGVFRIARRVSADRIISTVDPETRHGHKTSARGFDGYKGHAAVDPDSEIITKTVVTAGNAGDASVAADLITDLTGAGPDAARTDSERTDADQTAAGDADVTDADVTDADRTDADRTDPGSGSGASPDEVAGAAGGGDDPAKVYGDAAYGSGAFQAHLENNNIQSGCKTQPPVAPGGRFAKDRFRIDTKNATVTCPAGNTVAVRADRHGGGSATFGPQCASCPLRDACTNSPAGRTINIGRHEDTLARARDRQAAPDWQADYRATRPKVERKLGHLMRHRHGGRRARMRGRVKIDADFRLLAAAANLARLARLGLRSNLDGWTVTTA